MSLQRNAFDGLLIQSEASAKTPSTRAGLFDFFHRLPTTFLSVCSLGGLLALWAVLSLGDLVSGRFLISPYAVLREMWVLLTEGYINVPVYIHLGLSLGRSLTGLSAAIIIGVPLGLVIGYNRVASAVLSPPLAMLRPVPSIALIPLAVLWFGIGEFAKVFLIFLASFLYITLSVANGVKEVRETLIRAAYMLGASNRQLFFYVIFPETLPSIMNAIKVGTAISWAVVVAAELVAAQRGLGYMVMDAATFFRIADVYVGIVFIGLVGFCLEQMIVLVESRLVHWSGK